MNNETELPADVLDAIHARRKVEAIKLLRESAGIGLKEAKEAVEAYESHNPQKQDSSRSSGSETGIGRVILIIFVIAAIYVANKFLS